MNCQQFETIVHDLARDGAPDSRIVSYWDQGLFHAQECDRCSARFAEARSLQSAMRRLALDDRDSTAPPHVEAALREAFRNRGKVASFSRHQNWAIVTAAFASAAVLVLALILGIHFGSKHQLANGSHVPKTNVKEQPVTNGSGPAQVADNSAVLNSELAALSMQDFTVLPNSDDMVPLDGGTVVHVTTTPSTLESLGVAIPAASMDQNSGEISADLLIDQMGMPRAIRFGQ